MPRFLEAISSVTANHRCAKASAKPEVEICPKDLAQKILGEGLFVEKIFAFRFAFVVAVFLALFRRHFSGFSASPHA